MEITTLRPFNLANQPFSIPKSQDLQLLKVEVENITKAKNRLRIKKRQVKGPKMWCRPQKSQHQAFCHVSTKRLTNLKWICLMARAYIINTTRCLPTHSSLWSPKHSSKDKISSANRLYCVPKSMVITFLKILIPQLKVLKKHSTRVLRKAGIFQPMTPRMMVLR